MEPIHTIRLKPGEQDRLLAGHPWIYQNELEGWPPEAAPGDLVDLHDSQGRFLGRGYLNPRTTIAVRVLARDRVPVDQNFFLEKIRQAQALRERLFRTHPPQAPSHPPTPSLPGQAPDPVDAPLPVAERSAYRVVHGEADGLPGLVVDRYGDAVAIQLLTAGMDRRRDLILSAVEEVLRPHTIVARNDSTMREREGLPRERAVIRGQIQPEPTVTINRLDVSVDLLGGQKTGLFLDQIDNYPLIERMAEGADVLDCFCYVGLWSLHAARYGATRVTGIDQSPTAIKQATALAERNGLADRCVFRVANAFDELRERDRRREAFDLVILDPPAFVKARNRIPEALAGYKEINLRAMRLLRPGGFLVTCSCSYHLSAEQFRHMLGDAARDVRRTARLVAQGAQGRDHPVLLGLAESEYLKCCVLQVL
ncbi:MAG TPA: class I SAM-dependent rRNA methyltransferase [Gemmataceae bacterium]|nr:class I SAM-dependent rRNA methyltransferase [Gemmataceae bacterium]